MSVARGVASAMTMLPVVAAGAGGAVGATPAFRLVFDGKHNESLWHEGPFTSSLESCSSGYAVDVEVDDATLLSVRRFRCTGRVSSSPPGSGHCGRSTGERHLDDPRWHGAARRPARNGHLHERSPERHSERSEHDHIPQHLDDRGCRRSAPDTRLHERLRKQAQRTKQRLACAYARRNERRRGSDSWRLVVTDRRKPLLPLAAKSGRSANGPVGSSYRCACPAVRACSSCRSTGPTWLVTAGRR